MKKNIILSIVVFCAVAFIFTFAYADSSSLAGSAFLGGKIIDTTAIQIQTLEDASFTCVVPGTSISIIPFNGSPTDYLIPFNVTPKTETTPNINQFILGIYNTAPTPVTCTNDETGATVIVNLNAISYFGTSNL